MVDDIQKIYVILLIHKQTILHIHDFKNSPLHGTPIWALELQSTE